MFNAGIYYPEGCIRYVMENWTIRKLLDWITNYFTEKSIDSPRLCAEILLSHVLGLERIQLYLNIDRQVKQEELTRLRELVKRAAAEEPVQYITGRCEFYSMTFKVTPATLIPRPETELLVEKCINFLRTRQGEKQVLDLGTGTGCIAAAIAKNHPKARITAVDISEDAVKAARENIEKHGLSKQIDVLRGDFFKALNGADRRFDVIVSNPPYVTESEYDALENNIKKYEPIQALAAGPRGTACFEAIASDIEKYIKPDGAVFLEIGRNQGNFVKELLNRTGIFAEIILNKDLSGCTRVVSATARPMS